MNDLFIFGLGSAWITALTTFNGVAQTILPNWVRGRSLAIYLTAFNGAMTLGSVCWGFVANYLGIPTTLVIGALVLVVITLLAYRVKLPKGEVDLAPSEHWEKPHTHGEVELDRGPVMIQIAYQIKGADQSECLQKLQQLSEERRKDGSYAWGVMENSEDPEQIIEWFLVESWAEYLRQHHRISAADADLQAEVKAINLK